MAAMNEKAERHLRQILSFILLENSIIHQKASILYFSLSKIITFLLKTTPHDHQSHLLGKLRRTCF